VQALLKSWRSLHWGQPPPPPFLIK
jgi:hypothetical protein